jgi:hypothetical protein
VIKKYQRPHFVRTATGFTVLDNKNGSFHGGAEYTFANGWTWRTPVSRTWIKPEQISILSKVHGLCYR